MVKAGRYSTLTMRDTGVGMDDATQSKIFYPFFTTKESGKGTGLGLSTVFGIVKQNGGYIDVSSCPGKGTQFIVFFPKASGRPGEQRRSTEIVPFGKGGESILVVEDQESVRMLLGEVLTNGGYKVLLAAGGQEAVRLLERDGNAVDLVVSDVVMPGMGGTSLMEELRRQGRHLPVILMSAYMGAFDEKRYLEMGASAVFRKPFKMDDLLDTVAALTRDG